MGERLHEELAAQLAVARQEVAKLAPIHQQLANLWIKYAEARDDAHEAREKLLDLIESTRMDVTEIERLLKEHDDAEQRIDLLEGELWGGEGSKGRCRQNLVGSLPRGIPMVVDESVEVHVIGAE